MPPKKMKPEVEKIEYMSIPLKAGYRYCTEDEAIKANKILLWGKFAVKPAKLEANKQYLHPPTRITRAKEFRRENLLAGVEVKHRTKKEKDVTKMYDTDYEYTIDDIALLQKFNDEIEAKMFKVSDEEASKLEDLQEKIYDNIERLEGLKKFQGDGLQRHHDYKPTILARSKGGAFEKEHGLGNIEQPYFYWYFDQMPKLARTKFRPATSEEAVNNNMVSRYGVHKVPVKLLTNVATIGHAGNIKDMTPNQLILLRTAQNAKLKKGRKEFDILAFRLENTSEEKYEQEYAEKMKEIAKNDKEITKFLIKIQNQINKIEGKPKLKGVVYHPLFYEKTEKVYHEPNVTVIEEEVIERIKPTISKVAKTKINYIFQNDEQQIEIPQSFFDKSDKLKTDKALKLKLKNIFLHPHHYNDKDVKHYFYEKTGSIEGKGLTGGKIKSSDFFNKIGSTLSNVGHKIEQGTSSTVNTIKSGLEQGVQYAKNVVYGVGDYPPSVRDIISKYGNQTITNVMIGRAPVPRAITASLNAVSGGTFQEGMNTQPYDKLFHLFMYLTLADGTKILFEKNSQINSAVNSPLPDKTETLPLTIPNQTTTLNEFLENGKKQMGDNFFPYDPHYNNCQDFIVGLLTGNGWINQQERNWIKQDTGQLFANNKYLGTVARGVTNLGGIGERLILGFGVTKLNKKKSHIQSVLFKCPEWEQSQAKDWLKEHKFKGLEVDVKPNHLRYRQQEPDENKYDYRTIGVGSNIEFVVGYKK